MDANPAFDDADAEVFRARQALGYRNLLRNWMQDKDHPPELRAAINWLLGARDPEVRAAINRLLEEREQLRADKGEDK